ncbi:MAG TPA: iron ABC transporter permease [Nitrospira sp.]|nr:iron ABC transporter permease [Nitrospira sp.]MCW5796076.1 iron ABC transporter permease [Nitrospira sp.]HMV56942.1 iron ABC transporter permease [Nitrospira sp.]HMX92223.1 iron ABC transporter permease [Nitrospira sp.]HMZ98526.1 iron ABC transporter permease [Nitrospira sp.]
MMPSAGHPTSPPPALTSPSLSPNLMQSGPSFTATDRPFQGAILTRSRWCAVMGALLLLSVILAMLCLQLGTQYIGMGHILTLVWSAVVGTSNEPDALRTTGVILLQVRLPRVLLGFLVGSCLAAVGVSLQALLRNPLADPYVLGVSSGAALGVAIAVLFGIGTTVLALSLLPVCGFAGSLVALLVIYRMAASYERLPIHSVLLAGVILNAIFSALIMFITSIMEPNRSFGMMAWLMGSLTAPAYPVLIALSVYLLVGLVLLGKHVRVLDILALGEEPARSLGINTERTKRVIFLLSALMTGAVVSFSGMIGFIGMIIPHAVRLVVGADHRLLLPASTLVGGMFLMVADTMARTLFVPSEVPVGVITALAGGPFFVYLLVWRKDRLA